VTLTIAWMPVALFGLAGLRVLGLTLAAPGWSWIPPWIRGAVALWITWALEPLALPSAHPSALLHWGPWVLAAGLSMVIGILMGLVLAFAFAALTTGGQLITSMLGVELTGNTEAGILSASSGFSAWLSWLGLVVFLQLGGLQQTVLALRASVIAIPLTQWTVPSTIWPFAASLLASLLATALLIALPVVAIVLAVILLIGVLSRAYPQLNAYFLASPAAILCAILALWALTPLYLPALDNLWMQTWGQISHLLALAQGR